MSLKEKLARLSALLCYAEQSSIVAIVVWDVAETLEHREKLPAGKPELTALGKLYTWSPGPGVQSTSY